ncbi:MAG: LysR family transcriptional regulator substrate-binding protein [Pseudobdellovibrionaceae bacterium]
MMAACPLFKGRIITIGCHPVVASYSLPKAFQTLGQKSPDYKIYLKHGTSRNIQTLIQMGQVDIGIVINPTFAPDLVIKRLAYDEVCVWSGGKKLKSLFAIWISSKRNIYYVNGKNRFEKEVIAALAESNG